MKGLGSLFSSPNIYMDRRPFCLSGIQSLKGYKEWFKNFLSYQLRRASTSYSRNSVVWAATKNVASQGLWERTLQNQNPPGLGYFGDQETRQSPNLATVSLLHFYSLQASRTARNPSSLILTLSCSKRALAYFPVNSWNECFRIPREACSWCVLLKAGEFLSSFLSPFSSRGLQ